MRSKALLIISLLLLSACNDTHTRGYKKLCIDGVSYIKALPSGLEIQVDKDGKVVTCDS